MEKENERTVTGMDECIEREAAIATIISDPPDAHYPQWYADKINAIPAADVAPVRHGRWIEPQRLYYGAKQYVCSLCWAEAFWDKHGITEKYQCCPNCGARMDLEELNEAE